MCIGCLSQTDRDLDEVWVVRVMCFRCGPLKLAVPMEILLMLNGTAFPCPICFAPSNTNVWVDAQQVWGGGVEVES